jgi:hypothetical protein
MSDPLHHSKHGREDHENANCEFLHDAGLLDSPNASANPLPMERSD